MSDKQFNVVAAVTAILVAWTILLALRGPDLVIEFIRGQALIPSLDVDRVTKIEVKKGATTVTLERRGETYLLVSRDSYPADIGRVNNLVQQCTGITCGREITSSKDAHAELQVDGEHESSTVVRFLAGDQEIVGVVVGKLEGSGNYIRLNNSDDVFLSEKSVFLDTDALNFIDKEIGDVSNIKSVVMSGGDRQFTILKDGAGQKLQDVPEGMVENTSELSGVFSATAGLTISDFFSGRDEDKKKLAGLVFTHKVVTTTESDEQYTFQVGKNGGDFFVKCMAKYVGGVTEKDLATAKDDAERKVVEEKLKALDRCQKFLNRHQSWVYKIQASAGENLTKGFKDLIEEDKDFLKVEAKDIGSVSVKKGDDVYALTSPKAGVVSLDTKVEGKKPKPFAPDSVLEAIKDLQWTERVPANDKQLEGLAFDVVYTARMRDHAEYVCRIGKNKDNRYYVKIESAYKGDAKDTSEQATISKGAVAKFNKRHKGHIYEVPGGPVDTMMTAKADLFMAKDAQPEEIQASHILISFKGASRSEQTRTKDEAKKKADDILKQVKAKPDDFAKLAKENSDGPTKDKGGDLGRFPFGQMAKPFSEAAFKLDPGQLCDKVVETEFGFHIIQRTK